MTVGRTHVTNFQQEIENAVDQHDSITITGHYAGFQQRPTPFCRRQWSVIVPVTEYRNLYERLDPAKHQPHFVLTRLSRNCSLTDGKWQMSACSRLPFKDVELFQLRG